MTKCMYNAIKRRTGKQFVDFLKRVEKRYDNNIQNIFLVLDNLSVHKSKKVKEEISKCCPRIKFVFLPVRSPELNLIEVRWLWLQRQAINNSTFKNEQEIGQTVSKWKNTYNKNHGKAITNILLRKFFHYFKPLKIMVKYFLEINGHKLCSKIEQILSDG